MRRARAHAPHAPGEPLTPTQSGTARHGYSFLARRRHGTPSAHCQANRRPEHATPPPIRLLPPPNAARGAAHPSWTRLLHRNERSSAAALGGDARGSRKAVVEPRRLLLARGGTGPQVVAAKSADPGARRVVGSLAGWRRFCDAVFFTSAKVVCRHGGRSGGRAGRRVAGRRGSCACRGVRARQRERGRRHAARRRNGPRVGLRAARGRRRCRTAPNQRHAGGADQRGWGNASRVQTSSSLLDRGRRGRAGQWRDAARVVPRRGPQSHRRRS